MEREVTGKGLLVWGGLWGARMVSSQSGHWLHGCVHFVKTQAVHLLFLHFAVHSFYLYFGRKKIKYKNVKIHSNIACHWAFWICSVLIHIHGNEQLSAQVTASLWHAEMTNSNLAWEKLTSCAGAPMETDAFQYK